MISSFFLAFALAASLFIQGTASAIIPAYILCLTLSFVTAPSQVRVIPLIWAVLICVSALLIAPPRDHVGIIIIINLLAMPCVALSSGKYAKLTCGVVIALFACGLIAQYLFFPEIMYNHRRAAFPLANPNNAGTIMAMAFVAMALCFDRTGKKLYLPFIALFGLALLATGSKGGILAAALSIAAYYVFKHMRDPRALMSVGLIVLSGMLAFFSYAPARAAFMQRVPIWEASAPLVTAEGSGIGTFYRLYPSVRTEHYTDGFFVHNDILQIAIEMGWPMALAFTALAVCIALTTNRSNTIPALMLLVVLLHSMVSFPFYLAPISILCGLCIAEHQRGTKYGR